MQSRKVGESALLDLLKLVAESRTVLCGTCWARYAHPCCPGSASLSLPFISRLQTFADLQCCGPSQHRRCALLPAGAGEE